MKKEVRSAANFLVDLLRLNSCWSAVIDEKQLLEFRKHVYNCLWHHYQDHWFPERPMKGSGYRCIRINGKMDPLIARAGELVGLTAPSLRSLFPTELTMWVDPEEVAYRIGENGSVCSLLDEEEEERRREAELGQLPMSPKPKAPPKLIVPPREETPSPSPPSSPSPPLIVRKPQQPQPSKPAAIQFHSPPRSPVFSNTQQQQQQQQLTAQQQQHLALFLMNGHNIGCKESLRATSALESARGMERLFVSS